MKLATSTISAWEGSGRGGMLRATERRFRFTAPLLGAKDRGDRQPPWLVDTIIHALVGAGITDPGIPEIAVQGQGRQAGSADR